jgi:hypothetical protein
VTDSNPHSSRIEEKARRDQERLHKLVNGHAENDVAALVANARGSGKLQNTRFLPDFPRELLTLPHGMGDLQAWILGYMTYPSPAAAGFTALAALSHFAMPHLRINSREGLGFNEQYLLLAPTGFGKEDLRKPFGKLAEKLTAMPPPAGGNLWLSGLARLQYSAPASQQGLHRLLEQHPAQTFLADEFAEWLGHAASDSHKQQALGYIMQAYSKAFETLAVPAIGNKEAPYVPVKHPRVLVFATSTAERMLETMTASQADSGAINRFVILTAEQERIAKRYDVTPAHYVPPAGVVDLVAWMLQLRDDNAVIDFSAEARALEQEHDSMVLEPLRFDDRHLAGRLNEQALKIAALIALSDRRTTVHRDDLATAYAIREGIYHRASALIAADGALSGMHATGRAHSQLATAFSNHPHLYRSDLPKMSRAYRGLSEAERATVVRSLIEDGYCSRHPTKTGSLISEVCKGKAA